MEDNFENLSLNLSFRQMEAEWTMEPSSSFKERFIYFQGELRKTTLTTCLQITISSYCEFINSFHATGSSLYSLQTPENQIISDVFMGYKKRPVAWNGLNCTRN